MKSGKPAPRALKRTLVGYDGHTIYKVHIIDQNKVIHIEGLQLFEGFKAKISIGLLDYNDGTPTFQMKPERMTYIHFAPVGRLKTLRIYSHYRFPRSVQAERSKTQRD